MPKQQLKAWLPTPEKLKQYRIISWLAPFLADPRLWHINRISLNRGVYVGVLCAFFPLPGQMLLAVIGAVIFRANVPMSIALTWLTNPLTTIPVFWVAYSVGATLLSEPIIGLRTIGVILTDLTVWLFGSGTNPFHSQIFSLKAFGLGLLICGVMCSMLCGIIFRYMWRYRIIKDWKKRAGYNAHIKFRHSKTPKNSNAQNTNDDFSI